MKRFGQHAVLKPEYVDTYKKLHADAWPDVLKTIKNCNLQNYSIFLKRVDLFVYFEYVGDDFDADMEKMAADPVTQDWWKHTKPCFERHVEGVYYQDMEEIFFLD